MIARAVQDLVLDRLAAYPAVLLVGPRKPLVVLDEAQSWPEVFTRLRGAIDRDRRRTGRFLLLGSVSPALMARVSESLAGRLSLVELTPLLLAELEAEESRARHWLCGGYPDGGVLAPRRLPRWQRDYLALLAQRDLPAWGLPAKPQTTDRLLRMPAALNGRSGTPRRWDKASGCPTRRSIPPSIISWEPS